MVGRNKSDSIAIFKRPFRHGWKWFACDDLAERFHRTDLPTKGRGVVIVFEFPAQPGDSREKFQRGLIHHRRQVLPWIKGGSFNREQLRKGLGGPGCLRSRAPIILAAEALGFRGGRKTETCSGLD